MAEQIAKLVIKKSSVEGGSPPLEFVEHGELALNYFDGKLFYRDVNNAIQIIGTKTPASLIKDQTFIGENTFSALTTFTSVAMTTVALADGVIAWDALDGNLATVTLTQNSQLASIANVSPGSYILLVTQDGVGAHTLEFGTTFMSSDGTPFEITATAGSTTVITILNTGDENYYLVGQPNFIAFGTYIPVVPVIGIPDELTPSGITGDCAWLNNTFVRGVDENGDPRWRLLDYSGVPLLKGEIRSDGGNTYVIETFTRETVDDPWVSDGDCFEVTAPATPWEGTWIETLGGPCTGSPVITPSGTTGVYRATITASPQAGDIGNFTDFYLIGDGYQWYGTDPIPTGTTFRAINPFALALPTRENNYLAPRNNDANAEWGFGLPSAGEGDNELFEFLYHTTDQGPIGTYQDAGLGGPTFVIEVTALGD